MKKPYASPQIIRVQLNHEQAVLSVCSTMASAINNIPTFDECQTPGAPNAPIGCRRGQFPGAAGVDDAGGS